MTDSPTIALPRPTLLDRSEVLSALAEVAALYPFIPGLVAWRSWELAAYRHYTLSDPVLDLGCGDGRFYSLAWPDSKRVHGVDFDPEAVEAARVSGVYEEVTLSVASDMPLPDDAFGSAFANCSLEHMDDLDSVFREVHRCLQPGGLLLASVATDAMVSGAQRLLSAVYENPASADMALAAYRDYHHLVNPLTAEDWGAAILQAGFEIVEYIPIVPPPAATLFLATDLLWHAKTPTGELGTELGQRFAELPGFQADMERVLASVPWPTEWNTAACPGAVFAARATDLQRPRRTSSASVTPRTAEVVGQPVSTEAAPAACWCGSTEALLPFSEEYGRCPTCDTLVATSGLSEEETLVTDDADDYYGREYWFAKATEERQQPDIVDRARLDLPERVMHWLAALLRYRLPPGKVLELGAAHGGFVALLRQAGFDATGLEMSPSIAEFARETFDVPMLVGPVEDQDIEPGSLDVVVMMDVLEHLPDPERTVGHCFDLLKPNGLLVMQTPEWRGDDFDTLVERNDPFLEHLRYREHLNLFSKRSAELLVTRLGAREVNFEPAMFGFYDMFVFASREASRPISATARAEALSKSTSARVIEAALELHERASKAESTADDRLAFMQARDASLVPFGPYEVTVGLEPAEGPFPEWDLPIIRWGGGPETVLRVTLDSKTRPRLRLAMRSDLAGQAVEVLWDEEPVTQIHLSPADGFTEHSIPLPRSAPGKHRLSLCYSQQGPANELNRAVIFQELRLV